tara:strand:+ start:1093 stop:1356 length:264 start_codon:yes stop_codon:yes gene_type:complete
VARPNSRQSRQKGGRGAPASNERSEALKGGANNSAKPFKRHKLGVGTYEGENRLAKQGNRSSESIAGPNADERARKRKPGKTGRPGR